MSASVPPPTIVVFEKRPRWTPELQRRLVGEPVHVRGCHSAGDVPGLAAAACVVLSLENAEGECLQVLGALAAGGADVPVIAIGSERSAGLEWPFRELGAVEFVAEPFIAEDIARICRRHVQQALVRSP
ncbi:MAG: hypothetical protein WD069_00835 [Planctomycetales bacterium]